MFEFAKLHWDKIVVAVVAVYGALLSTYNILVANRKAKVERKEKKQSERTLKEINGLTQKIAAKSALLSSYNQYFTVMEEKNNIFLQKNSGQHIYTQDVMKNINTLEGELIELIQKLDS